MANTQLIANGKSITVFWESPNFAANPGNPTAAEINAGINVTNTIAWENFSFGSQASTQTSDPALGDVGNTQTRGFSQFGGTVSFFYPRDYSTPSPELSAFLALEEQYTLGYLVIRVDGAKKTAGSDDVNKPILTGDFVHVYKVMSDGWSDVNTGEVNFKYTITFQPQGDLWINAYVGTVAVSTPAPIGATAYTVGGRTPLSAFITGRQLSSVTGQVNGYPGWFDWTSSNPSVAYVDGNGVLRGVSGGTTQIAAVWPHTNTASTALSVTIAP